MEEIEIVIGGGGICGLATALALHRKGIKSVILERAECIRETGAAIGVFPNGWRVLDQLGVASDLRSTALQLLGVGECQCLKRNDLVNALANHLPSGTIRFNSQIISVELDPSSSYPILHLQDGKTIRAKVLIGCDGANSVIGDFLGLKPKRLFGLLAVRGFTEYPERHGLPMEGVRMRSGNTMSGGAPVNDHLLYWFLLHKWNPTDIAKAGHDPKQIQKEAIETLIEHKFPAERIEVVKRCDLNSLSLTHLSYRPPWEVLLGSFRRETVTVAGDAMHVMGPFLAQGGSAAMEDAVVLAKCLAKKLDSKQKIEEALDEYIKERRMRLVWLSTQTYLVGSLLDTSSLIKKIFIMIFMAVLFRDPNAHTKYDCGRL
ncbi:FAD-dependent monooxygenase ausM-like isoform X2 [Carica papaya]|uniref:FAD-dependent monooxygenase ausM-like isoform X2 n=1 Tax=Carica papaya TaxID=3649 RepID=UPI000B8C9FAF|nr:FAD-dependent monooxygenase ausM-like isoform X2 [Carica papaya]